MYLEFTHSQSFETFVRCHIHAFSGPGRHALAKSGSTIWPLPSPNTMAIWCDSIRAFSPSLANTASSRVLVTSRRPGKKGKSNEPSDMCARTSGRCARSPIWRDVNAQARQWLNEVANQRRHRETGQAPDERFQPEALRPLPLLTSGLPRYRRGAGPQRSPTVPSTATATACRLAMSGASSPSKPMLPPSPSTISIRRSSVMPAPGSAARLSAPNVSRKNSYAQMAAAATLGRATAPGRCCSDPIAEAISATARRYGPLPRPASPRTVRTDSRIRPGSSRRRACRKPMPRVRSAPTTSPTFSASSKRGAKCSRRSGSKIRN